MIPMDQESCDQGAVMYRFVCTFVFFSFALCHLSCFEWGTHSDLQEDVKKSNSVSKKNIKKLGKIKNLYFKHYDQINLDMSINMHVNFGARHKILKKICLNI